MDSPLHHLSCIKLHKNKEKDKETKKKTLVISTTTSTTRMQYTHWVKLQSLHTCNVWVDIGPNHKVYDIKHIAWKTCELLNRLLAYSRVGSESFFAACSLINKPGLDFNLLMPWAHKKLTRNLQAATYKVSRPPTQKLFVNRPFCVNLSLPYLINYLIPGPSVEYTEEKTGAHVVNVVNVHNVRLWTPRSQTNSVFKHPETLILGAISGRA